jgi:hypothetical protein
MFLVIIKSIILCVCVVVIEVCYILPLFVLLVLHAQQ